MKTIAMIASLFVGMATQCFAAGDAVSSVTKSDREETTTFQRDGKTILKVILYRPNEPEHKRLLRQVIFHNDEVMAEVTEFQGKRIFDIRPRSGVSFGIQQDGVTGALENIMLRAKDDVVEIFEVKNGRLTPLSGKQLDFNRNLASDVRGLFAPENLKKTTPEKFVKQAEDLVKKYKSKESEKQDGTTSGDKPASTPKPAGKPVELTVRVVEYTGDRMHSSAIGEGGAIYHRDAFDAAVCEILSPAAYAGQRLQIWGWNRKEVVDPKLREKGSVVRVRCDFPKRRASPWKSGPKGFGQWEVQLSKAPASRQ